MTKVVLITTIFPFGKGEEFLETEVKYWELYLDRISLVFMPKLHTEGRREINKDIELNSLFFEKQNTFKAKCSYFFKSLKSALFWKGLVQEVLINPLRFPFFVRSLVGYNFALHKLEEYILEQKDTDKLVFYTYWHTEVTYALQTLKKKYEFKLITRAHGWDVYKERKKLNYMPLRQFFTKNLDALYVITNGAITYLSETYGFNSKNFQLARLGVDDLGIVSPISSDNSLMVVSCSSLIQVKRVDKIIDGLSELAKRNVALNITWTHIGHGKLKDKLLLYAKEKLNIGNVSYQFFGNLDNKEVYKYYQKNTCDVFINVSESEGVPVSIMEAMSCHIPIVAPNVGGIQDMVKDGYNGVLLSEHARQDELVDALGQVAFWKQNAIRENAYKVYKDKYDASKNYPSFITEILE